jgi:hypothetical protein
MNIKNSLVTIQIYEKLSIVKSRGCLMMYKILKQLHKLQAKKNYFYIKKLSVMTKLDVIKQYLLTVG